MYDVFDVAAYIINKSIESGKPVSNLKLQKLLFYVQANFLVNLGKACFEEEIQAWKHGPVVPRIYREFRDHGEVTITNSVEFKPQFVFKNDELTMELVKVHEDLEANIKHANNVNEVLSSYAEVDPWDLVDKTHNEIWRDVYDGTDNIVIKTEDIEAYYQKYPNRILGY